MVIVLSLEPDTRIGLVASAVWIVFIVVAALINRHRMLTRAETGMVLPDD